MKWIAFLFLFAMPCQQALPQEIKFPSAPSPQISHSGEVEGVFRLPSNAPEKSPAVVIIHTRGGYDAGHSELYAAPLRQAGIATLDLILARYPLRAHVPSDFIPHVFGALKYLSSHPQIDSQRIGIMGMSLGGILAIYSTSEKLLSEHMGSNNRFRFSAHAALYPVCNIHERAIRGATRNKRLLNAYEKLTGAPVLILAGGKDLYDDPDSCQQFISALPGDGKSHMTLLFFPEATHGWDQGRNRRSYDNNACKGRGCDVEYVSDPGVTAKGRDAVIDFFSSKLATSQAKN